MKNILSVLSILALFAAGNLQAAAEVGQPAPDFTLTSAAGNSHSLSDFKGKIVVLEWVNHSCPFVVKHYNSGNMQALQAQYTGQEVVWLSICSSAEGKQGYMTPEQILAARSAAKAAATAYLIDASGEVGRLYDARRTPEMFIIDAEGTLVYHGAIDSNSSPNPDTIPEATNYVAAALDALIAGEPISESQTRPYGCSVKY